MLRSDTLTGFQTDTQLWWRARAFDGFSHSVWSLARTFLLRVEPRQFVVPTDFATVNDAVRIAIDKDTIALAAGVYQENIEIVDKAIVLRGINGRDATIIEPLDDSLPILRRSGDNSGLTTIEGLTFRDGGYGRGVVLETCRVVFRDNAVADCKSSQSGAGLYILRIHGEVSNNLFHDDSSGTYGGGVSLYQTSNDTLSFDHNRLYANYAERGSALFVPYGQSSSTIDHNLFHDNTGAEGAGAYAGQFSAMRFDNNTFVRNDDALRIQDYHRTIWHNLIAFNRGSSRHCPCPLWGYVCKLLLPQRCPVRRQQR